jgi:hypothetical protein
VPLEHLCLLNQQRQFFPGSSSDNGQNNNHWLAAFCQSENKIKANKNNSFFQKL